MEPFSFEHHSATHLTGKAERPLIHVTGWVELCGTGSKGTSNFAGQQSETPRPARGSSAGCGLSVPRSRTAGLMAGRSMSTLFTLGTFLAKYRHFHK